MADFPALAAIHAAGVTATGERMRQAIKRYCYVFLFCSFVLLTGKEVAACGADYPSTPQGVVSSFLREDFTGGGNYWERISPYTTWVDSPGWDVTVLISSYKVQESSVTLDESTVKVEYRDPVEYTYNDTGPTLKRLGDKDLVQFRLTKVDGCWRIKTPKNPPHLNARHVIDDFKRLVGSERSSKDRNRSILRQLLLYYEK